MKILQAERSLDLLVEPFKTKAILALNEIQRKYGDIIFVTETYRSYTRQLSLYIARYSKTLKSKHRDGLALDIAFKGDVLYPESIKTRRPIIDIFNKYGIDWGYDLWKRDMPHLQDNGKPLDYKLIIMGFYKEIYKEENQNNTNPILNVELAVEKITEISKTNEAEALSELMYFLCIGLERINKKKSLS